MKFCLKNRQNKEYLLKADEIKMDYRDYKSIPDLFEDYPNIPIIVQISWYEDVNWEELVKYKDIKPDYLICCISTKNQAEICKDLGFKFYYGYPITSYYELRNWLNLGVCYIRLGAPLFFDLPNVKNITKDIPIRAIPNIADEEIWAGNDGIVGTWIRPEDLIYYEDYVDILEFEDCNNEKEQALFRIYAEQCNWPGNVDMLISNINTSALNRLISKDFGKKRINCKQYCQINGNCQYCYWTTELANKELIKNYAESQKNK